MFLVRHYISLLNKYMKKPDRFKFFYPAKKIFMKGILERVFHSAAEIVIQPMLYFTDGEF